MRTRSLARLTCVLLALWLAVPAPAYAQGRATLNGVVVGPGGTPQPNVTLVVTNSSGVDRRAVSGPDGNFVFGGLQPGLYRLRTDDETFAPFSQDAIALTPGQVLSLKIALVSRVPQAAAPTQRATIQGTVIGPGGVPAGNVTLIISNAEGVDRRVVSDPNGAFVFGGLQPGTYRLRIEDPGVDARPFPPAEIVFAPGERRQFDIRLQPLPPPVVAPPTPPPPVEPKPALPRPAGPVATVPVSRPSSPGDVPEVTAPGGEFEAMPSRWDFKFPAYVRYEDARNMPWVVGSAFDPYNQNAAKGDFPVFGSQTLFANLTLQLNSTINPRDVGAGEASPTRQVFDNHNFVAGLELFRGNTVFQPKSWAIRGTVVGNLSGLSASSNNVRTQTYGVEEAFVEKRIAAFGPAFDFMSVRGGMQNFNSDFRGYLFADNQLGVRLFGNASRNRYQYNLAYFDLRDRDAGSQLHRFSSRNHRVVVANAYIQDFASRGYTAMVNLHVSRDSEAPEGSFGVQQVVYAGVHGDGKWGGWSVSHAFYEAMGNDDRPVPAGSNPAPTVKIRARMAAIELARDADWLRYRLSGYYASGDDGADPGTAKGFDTITDNPNLAGGQFMYWTQQKTAVGPVEKPVLISEKFSLLPNLRTKFGGRANFANPGLMLVNGGIDMRLSPRLKVVTNLSLLQFANSALLRNLAGTSPGFEDAAIGWDLSIGGKYRPLVNENLFVVFGYSTLIPRGGFRTSLGAGSPRLQSFVAALQVAY